MLLWTPDTLIYFQISIPGSWWATNVPLLSWLLPKPLHPSPSPFWHAGPSRTGQSQGPWLAGQGRAPEVRTSASRSTLNVCCCWAGSERWLQLGRRCSRIPSCILPIHSDSATLSLRSTWSSRSLLLLRQVRCVASPSSSNGPLPPAELQPCSCSCLQWRRPAAGIATSPPNFQVACLIRSSRALPGYSMFNRENPLHNRCRPAEPALRATLSAAHRYRSTLKSAEWPENLTVDDCQWKGVFNAKSVKHATRVLQIMLHSFSDRRAKHNFGNKPKAPNKHVQSN